MQILKKTYIHISSRGSLYFFAFLMIFTIDRHHRYEASVNPDLGPFEYDVAEYYSYLPQLFYGTSEEITQNILHNKRTIGMAIMYSPAFIIGHLIAQQRNEKINGYSKPYQWAIRWESILISIGGLLFSRKSLKMFFNDTVVLVSLLGVFFGTNLFYYTYSLGEMPHSYLFFLYSIFIFLSLRLILENCYKNILWLGLIGGIIVLIRPTDALILIFPLLFNISSFTELKIRIKTFLQHRFYLIFSSILFMVPLVIQMLMWKKHIDHYIFYSYNNERFFFNDPQIMNFLFSYRKGWLIYTPIMLFSLIGILLSKKHLKEFFIFLIIFTLSNIYVLSCWWDWGFGGSFGCRALIQSYAVLIFPLAIFISWCYTLFKNHVTSRVIFRTFSVLILFLFIRLNLFQIWQYKYHIIHWSGMNEKAYKYVFLKEVLTKEELIYLHSSIITPPDPIKMMRGIRN